MKNLLLEKLKRGEKPIGVFSVLGGAARIESIAMAGVDYVILDNEHGPQDPESNISAIIAAERHGLTVFVRPRDHTRPALLKNLDVGAQGLIVPYVRSVEEVLILIGRAKYQPVGDRGFGAVRVNGFGMTLGDIKEYFAEQNEQTLLIPQCETRGCLDNLEDIVALQGVDGIFVGPYDLSIALGVPGDMDSPVLIDALKRVSKVCKDAGKYSFIYAGSPQKAKQFYEIGFDSVTAGLDAQALAIGLGGIVKAAKE